MAKKQEWVEDSVGLNKRERIFKQIAYNLILILVCMAVLFPLTTDPHIAMFPSSAKSSVNGI